MNCETVRRDLNALADHQLDPEWAIEISRHLAECHSCSRAFTLMQSVTNIVQEDLRPREAPSLAGDIMRRLPLRTSWGYALWKPVATWRGLVPITLLILVFFWSTQQLGAVTHELDRLETKRYIEKIYHVLKIYRKTTGRYPDRIDDLTAAAKNTRYPKFTRQLWLGLSRRDAWKSSFGYRASRNGQSFWLYSYGPNRVDELGAGDDILPGL